MEPLHLSIIELRDDQCHFPLTDDLPHTFCGHQVKEGSAYCPKHHAVVWVPALPRVDSYVPARKRAVA